MKKIHVELKRLASIVLAMAMLLVSVPIAFPTHAAAAVASGTTGDCTWELNGTVLTIGGGSNMARYSYNSPSPWGMDITEVIIQDGVMSIGDYAFYECTELTSITIPDGLASIGYAAFGGCESLTDIRIPDSVAGIDDEAFSGCASLTSITIPYGVESIGTRTFYECTELTSVSLPDSVTYIRYLAFGGCASLTDVTIPDSVTEIGDEAFSGCTSLTSLIIPGSVTSIGTQAFANCGNIADITVDASNPVYHSDGNCLIKTADKELIVGCRNSIIPSDGSVTSIGKRAFCGCTGLTSITIPGSVTSIGSWAFNECTGLTELTILHGVESIGDWAFYGCTSLTSVMFPDSVTHISGTAFGRCTNVARIVVDASNPVYHSDGNCLIQTADKKLVVGCKSSVIPSDGSVTSIGMDAFYACTELKKITIPNSVTTIEQLAFGGCAGLTSIAIPNSVTSIADYAFFACTGLTEVNLSGSVTHIGERAFGRCGNIARIVVDASNPVYHSDGNCLIQTADKKLVVGCKNSVIPRDGSVTSIGEDAFFECTGLTEISIPGGVTSIDLGAFMLCTNLKVVSIADGVTSIGEWAFNDCSGLINVYIPNSVTSIGYEAFSGCTSLTSITIPDGVTSIGGSAFYGCTGLTSITIPDSMTEIGNDVFSGCTGLTSVTIPDSVTSIGSAFSGCTGLTSITIPDSVTNISGAFSGCTGLTSITIPSSVTSIGSGTFSNCTGLTSITIPDSVTSIGYEAFRYCTGLTSITIPDSVTSIGYEAFYNTAYWMDENNWEDGVLYIGNHLIKAKDNVSGNYTVRSGVKTMADSAFSGHWNLTSITLPDSMRSIGKSALSGCHNLTNLTIPDGVTSIGGWAFGDCRSLTNMTIPESVTSIGERAFMDCTALTSITIPDSVTSIGNSAFNNCSDLCIRTPENSYAHRYAKENDIRYFLTELTGSAARPVIDSSRMTEDKRLEVTLRAVDGYEYRCDDGAWQQSPVFGDLYLGGEHRFCQRIAATEDHAAGVESEALCFTFVESITAVSTKELIESYSGHQSTHPDGSEYFVYSPQITYTVAYDGGKTFTGTASELYEEFGEWVSGTYNNQWHVGENTCSFSFMGVKGECTVTVVKNPIESITAVNTKVLIENGSGYWTTSADGKEYFVYSPWITYTVTYDGGKTFTGTDSELYVKFGESVSGTYQSYENQWHVGENTYRISFMGVEGECKVTVIETPVKSLTINDATIVENTGGYYSEELGYYIYNSIYSDALSGTVELKDGRQISFDGYVSIDNETYSLSVDVPNQENAPWTVGNSYEVTGNFLGVSAVFRVTIVPCPIESVSVGEVKVIAGTHGYENENGQYIYTTGFDSVPFSVKMRDGRVLTSQCGQIGIDETWYDLEVDLPDQTKDPWTVGSTHTLTARIGSLFCTFNVTIIDNPIRSLTIDPVVCAEGTWGDYDYEKGYFRYGDRFWNQSFSVTLRDGTVVRSGYFLSYNYNCGPGGEGGFAPTLTLYGMNYGALHFDDTQDETHWGVGEHYITGSLPELDISARMKVTVMESPVERLQIEDMLYVPDGESWRDLRPVYTLYFKDGTKKTVTDDATWREAGSEYLWNLYFSINDDRRQDLADGETYEMTGSFGHLTDTFRVTVAAGIIRSLELVSPPAKTAYTVGECFDVRGAVLRVGYSDGTSEDVALNNSGLHTQFEQAICLRKLNATVTVSWKGEEMLKEGQQKATITLLGRSVECPIEVTGSMPRALTVRVGADKTPIFTMTYNDGKTVDLRLLDFEVSGGYSDLDVGSSGGYIETDKGLFTYSWDYSRDGGVFTIGGAQSNALQDTEWFRRYQTTSGDSLLPSLRFSGQLTAENIDGLICHFCGSWSAGGSGAQIRKRLQEACGIDNADLSLSKHYNPATDTYRITDFYRITPAVARRLTYQNGTWTMWAQLTDGTTYRATFDGDGRLLRLNAPGDLDSDGEVTDWDGVLLARYLAGWTMDAQDAAMLDIDGDGEVTDWDGVLLDRYLAGWDVTL